MDPVSLQLLHGFALIGITLVLYYLVRAVRGLTLLLRGGKDVKQIYGNWAVVTGATDGIGKATCFELARKGCNVVLISRTQSKLDAVAKEIRDVYPSIQTKTLAIDYNTFSHDGDGSKTQLKKVLEELGDDFGLLVNNVGISYDFPNYFHELDEERVKALIELNVSSTTLMTHLAIPYMLKRQENLGNQSGGKRSAIVNVGSAAGLHPNPLLSQYSAAKAYVKYFSQSLNTEYAGRGIDVSVVAPYFIVSKLSKFKRPAAHIPTAEHFSECLVNSIGSGNSVENPFLPHTIMGFVATSLPERFVLGQILNFHLGFRKRALKKKNEKSD